MDKITVILRSLQEKCQFFARDCTAKKTQNEITFLSLYGLTDNGDDELILSREGQPSVILLWVTVYL